MKILVDGRQTGKTSKLITWVEQGSDTGTNYPFWSRIIVTATENEAQRIREILKERNPEEDTYRWVFSIDDWKTSKFGIKPPEVAIDNLDWILGYILGWTPAIVTMQGQLWDER